MSSHWAYRRATSCGCVSRFSCRAALAAQHAVTTRGSHSAAFPKSGKEKKERKNVVITPNALYFPAFVYPRLRYFPLVSRCCLCNALLVNLMSSSRGGGERRNKDNYCEVHVACRYTSTCALTGANNLFAGVAAHRRRQKRLRYAYYINRREVTAILPTKRPPQAPTNKSDNSSERGLSAYMRDLPRVGGMRVFLFGIVLRKPLQQDRH